VFCNKLLLNVKMMVRLIKVLNFFTLWEKLLKLELLFILFLLFKLLIYGQDITTSSKSNLSRAYE